MLDNNNFLKPKTMETIYLEIKDAQGGKESKLLVEDMRDIYIKTAKNNNFKCEAIEDRDGFVCLCL